MSPAARSVFVFGIYLVLLALFLILVPNVLLGLFGLSTTEEVWIRVVGMLVGFLGYYYILAARKEWRDFFRWTVYPRSTVILFFVSFVLLGLAEPPLILFAVVDLLAAVWTASALRSAPAK